MWVFVIDLSRLKVIQRIKGIAGVYTMTTKVRSIGADIFSGFFSWQGIVIEHCARYRA